MSIRKPTRDEILRGVAAIDDVQQKGFIISQWLDLAPKGDRGLSRSDLDRFFAADVELNRPHYVEALKQELGEVGMAVVSNFYDHPAYLARALVRIYPTVFYRLGLAYPFVLKLRGDLGPVWTRPRHASDQSDLAVFMEAVPEAVRRDLAALERERRFREYLYYFSRNPEVGREELASELARAQDMYTRDILAGLQNDCDRLLAMEFPGLVPTLDGFLFPSFHVRWWIDSALRIDRVLNIGDTGTQKTAFAVAAAHQFGCQRVLVLCPPHAREQWRREISRYFVSPDPRTVVIRRRKEAKEAVATPSQFTVVGYTAISDGDVRSVLKDQPFDMLIWDECHYGKNLVGNKPSSRALACAEVIKELPLRRLLALSATPWENHPREFAPVAAVLRPDLFGDAADVYASGTFEPRLLRELFAENIVDVDLHEVMDLPPVDPKPWENLFGEELVEMDPAHRVVYELVREATEPRLEGAEKALRLLQAAIHPHGLVGLYEWPEELRNQFNRAELSTKLMWIRERVEQELREGAKVAIGTGICVSGLTRPRDDEREFWLGAKLQEWFGKETVLLLDGSVSHAPSRRGLSRRQRLIERWRHDSTARILLASTRACPDAINLSVSKQPGIAKLFLTAVSFPWLPWKQFQGRFLRPGAGVPFSYRVPVLRGTIDESLFRLVEEKWRLQQTFRAHIEFTEREQRLLGGRIKLLTRLAPDAWSNIQAVNFTGGKLRECNVDQAQRFLNEQQGLGTNAERFAQAFLAIQEFSPSGHVARFMRQVITAMEAGDLLDPSGILDAGCGPLTLERTLGQPVYGVDMNEPLLRLGKERSSLGGVNARVSFLSSLPQEWKHKFALTVSSLVLDWTSRRRLVGKVPIRVAVMRELVRVTHPAGRVWLTFTERALTQQLLDEWRVTLVRNEYQLVDDLTGLVRAVDHRDCPFAFWSICFCPEGKPLADVRCGELEFTFEREQLVMKRGRKRSLDWSSEPKHVRHDQFVVSKADGKCLAAQEAARIAIEKERERIARLANVPWRSWLEMQRRGVSLEMLMNR